MGSLWTCSMLRHTGEQVGGKGDFSPKCLSGILFRLVNHQCWFFRMRGCRFCQLDQERAGRLPEVS